MGPALLTNRLRAHGLPAATPIIPHANRQVLVSRGARGALHVHLGYAAAPDEVLAAIALWARPRLPRQQRRAAQRILIAFPVHDYVPPGRAPRRLHTPARPGDEGILARLQELHAELNKRHFGGVLGAVRFVLSSRMRSRLGEFRPVSPAHPIAEIGVSRRHLRRDGWDGVADTVAHEMVHQWQAETGRRLGHGPEFRQRCLGLGLDGRATRRVDRECR